MHKPFIFLSSFSQGTALVHIYLDGTIFLATGSMELGQGLNTKMTQVRLTKRFSHPLYEKEVPIFAMVYFLLFL